MSQASSRLHTALRAHAAGLHACEAATELLIAHNAWLRREDFLDRFTHTGASLTDGTEMTAIDWPGAIIALNTGELPCSGGEQRILRLTASLADGIPVDLRQALVGLDNRNSNLVIQAVRHTSGQRATDTVS